MVTARFRVLYVFVALEVGTRQILHWNVTEHPTAEWTIQQFRTVMTPETSHRFVLHAAADVASDSLRIDQVRRDGGEHQIDGRFRRSVFALLLALGPCIAQMASPRLRLTPNSELTSEELMADKKWTFTRRHLLLAVTTLLILVCVTTGTAQIAGVGSATRQLRVLV